MCPVHERHRRSHSTLRMLAAFLPLGGTPMSCRSQARGAPDGEPAGQVLLELQVVAEHALDLQLKGVVAVVAATERREGIERAALVEVDERKTAVVFVPERDQRTQQLRAEAAVDERAVHRV